MGVEAADCILTGKMMYLYFYFKTDKLPGNPAVAINVNYKAMSSYAILPVFDSSEPYAPIATCWISGGALTVYGDKLKPNVRYYVCGMYVTQ